MFIFYFLCFKKNEKDFLRREFHSLSKFMQHEVNKTNTNTIMFNLFLYFKYACIKEKSDMYLRKIQISF